MTTAVDYQTSYLQVSWHDVEPIELQEGDYVLVLSPSAQTEGFVLAIEPAPNYPGALMLTIKSAFFVSSALAERGYVRRGTFIQLGYRQPTGHQE